MYTSSQLLDPQNNQNVSNSQSHQSHTDADVKNLCEALERLPPLVSVLGSLSSATKSTSLATDLVDLLAWNLNNSSFTLQHCVDTESSFSKIQLLTGQSISSPCPTHIFEVHYHEVSETKWQSRVGGRSIMHAYHGSRIENFHSILHHGLAAHMNKNSLYGEGTYLSSELSVSMPYAPSGKAWDKSRVGTRIACLAVCEMIDHASVKCQVKNHPNHRSRSRASGSMGGDVPEKYYVVQNNDMVRVKYLIVYADKRTPVQYSSSWRWLQQHRFALMMIFYAFLLLAVGFYNSKTGQYIVKRYLR